jgi:SAM-dependent methyltransferase
MRPSATQEYNRAFFESIADGSLRSAEIIVPLLLQRIRPTSVVDVGCGDGAWLHVFERHGVTDVFGVDGDYVPRSQLRIPTQAFQAADLSQPLRLERQFDLALSLEVGEHLPPASGPAFIESLVRLAPVIVFSAAIPGQGGTNHVNEQWQSYWAALFEERGYYPIDCIRPITWNHPEVELWYAQNCLVYVHADALESYPEWRATTLQSAPAPLDLVHPRMYLLRHWDNVPPRIYVRLGPRVAWRTARERVPRWFNRRSGNRS